MANNGTTYDRLSEDTTDDLSHENADFQQNSDYLVQWRKYNSRLYHVSIMNLLLLAVQILLIGGFLTKNFIFAER